MQRITVKVWTEHGEYYGIRGIKKDPEGTGDPQGKQESLISRAQAAESDASTPVFVVVKGLAVC